MPALTDEERTELKDIFSYFDEDKNGLIDYAEFTRLLDGLDANMSSEEMRIGFDATDIDNNGFIDVEEFIEWWCGP